MPTVLYAICFWEAVREFRNWRSVLPEKIRQQPIDLALRIHLLILRVIRRALYPQGNIHMEKSIFGQLCYAGILIVLFLFDAVMLIPLPASANSENVSSPKKTTKLVFIHHSCGENWLTDGHGNLAKHLMTTITLSATRTTAGDPTASATVPISRPGPSGLRVLHLRLMPRMGAEKPDGSE